MARRSLHEHELSDWNPMSADFYDPTFNNYAQGPGSRLDRNLLPSNPRSNRVNAVFTLYVKDIPTELSKDGIRNVFSNYGLPLSIYRHETNMSHTCGYTYALISYASHREAELAIRELDGTPPFYFKVQFARSPAEKDRIRRLRQDEDMLSRAVQSQPFPQPERSPFASFSRGIGRGRGIPLPRHMGMARPCPGRYEQPVYHNGDTDTVEDTNYFSSYVPGAYEETNRLIMKQRINHSYSSANGVQWVSMGRGYFPASERPPFDIEIEKYGKDEKHMLVQSVEQMYKNWFEYGQKEGRAGKSGKCSYCHRMASKYCQQCMAWYCTQSCQQKDWPRHRTVCIPKLSESDAGCQLNHAPAQAFDAKQSPEAKPERSDFNQASGQNVGGSSVGFEHGDSMVNSYGYKEHNKANFKENKFQQKDNDGLSRNTDHDKNRSEHHNVFTDGKNGKYRSNNSSIESCMEDTERKKRSVNERLRVARQEEGGRNASLARDSVTSLQIHQQPEPVSCSVDSAVTKMESLNISNSTSVGCSKHKELPEDRFRRTSTSAAHVEGERYKSAVTPLEKKQLHTNSSPQKSGEMKRTIPRTLSNTPDKSPPQPVQPLRSVVDGLKVGMQGGGELRKQLFGGDYSVTIVYPELRNQYTALFEEREDLKVMCEFGPDEKYRPNIGDMVFAPTACESEEDGIAWSRARILSVSNSGLYNVSLCDIGCTGTVKVVKQLSDDLASLPEFAARCRVISCTKSKEKLWPDDLKQFLFTVTSVDETQKAVTCVLKSASNEEMCKVVLKQWAPAVEDEGLKTVELKNNDSVVLQVFFDQKSLYVRPVSSNAKDMFCQLNQDIGRHCLQAVEIDHLPVKKELVACRFLADGNYYRAKVLDVTANTVKVVYVDYGNMDCATKDRLKPLPDSLKRIPCMVAKVGLKDALDRPLTVDANEFLSDLVGREVELKLILTGSRRDEVQLILPDGSSVNDTLNTMLEPDWKRAMAAGKDPRETRHFVADDIKYLELPVGQTVDFLVLHKLDSVTFMGCEADGKIMAYVHTTMTDEMNRYCVTIPEKSYVPRQSELCFAKFEDGVWYRAMCLGGELSVEKNVVFLDFGNMAYVAKENMRKMIEDYVETPVIAVMCSLQGLENADETLKNRVCELVQVNKTYKARILSCPDAGTYFIEFPHVTETLIKENLLPSGEK